MAIVDNYKETKPKAPFQISDDEYLIKDYFAATMKKPDKGEAHLALTNKRAIIYFWTGKGVIVNGANISEITATDILWGKRKRRLAGIIALGIGIISLLVFMPTLLSTITDPYMYQYLYYNFLPLFYSIIPIVISALLVVIGVYLFLKERYTFIVTLYIKSVTGAISLHNYPLSGGISGFFANMLKPSPLKLEGKPGPDAELMAKEVGALILDIQRGSISKQ